MWCWAQISVFRWAAAAGVEGGVRLKDDGGSPRASVRGIVPLQVRGLVQKAGLRTRHNSASEPMVATLAVVSSICHPSASFHARLEMCRTRQNLHS